MKQMWIVVLIVSILGASVGAQPAFPVSNSAISDVIQLEPGWNLVRLPQASAGANTTCTQADLISSYLFDPWTQEYIRTGTTAYDSFVSANPDYVALSSGWINMSRRCTVAAPVESMATVDTPLRAGWNFLSVLPDVVGKSLQAIHGSCDIEQAFLFNSASQQWESVAYTQALGDTAVPQQIINHGLIVKVMSHCELGLDGPPQLPDDGTDSPVGTISVNVMPSVVNATTGAPVGQAAITYTVDGVHRQTSFSNNEGLGGSLTVQSGQTLQLRVEKEGYQTLVASYTIPSSSSTFSFDIKLVPSAATVTGVVVKVRAQSSGDNAQTLANARVTFRADGATYPGGETDFDGWSAPVTLQAGQSVLVTIEKEGFDTYQTAHTVPSGASFNIMAHLWANATQPGPVRNVSVSARVFEGNGSTPVSSAQVTAIAAGFEYSLGATGSNGVTSGIVTLPSNSTFRLRVEKQGYTTLLSETFSVPSDNSTYRPTVRVAAPSSSVAIQARILTATGNPISGASVTFAADGYTYPGGTTNAQGYSGTVTLQRGQSFTVQASATGYAASSHTFTAPSSGAAYTPEVRLNASVNSNVTVLARLLDSSGNGLSGVAVSYDADGYTYPGGLTDASGYAGQVILARGQTFTVHASKAGYTSRAQSFSVPQSPTISSTGVAYYLPEMALTASGSDNNAGATLRSSRVKVTIDGTTTPLAGVTVRILRNGNYVATQTSGTDGFTPLIGLRVGESHSFELAAAGYVARTITGITIPAGSGTFTVGPYGLTASGTPNSNAVSIRAKILGNNGLALSGVSVSYRTTDGYTYPGGTTNAQGLATAVTLQRGQGFSVHVTATGYPSPQSKTFGVPATGTAYEAVFQLDPGASSNTVAVQGKILGSNGLPLSGATVSYRTTDLVTYPGGITNSQGLASVAYLPRGAGFTMDVLASGYPQQGRTFGVPTTGSSFQALFQLTN